MEELHELDSVNRARVIARATPTGRGEYAGSCDRVSLAWLEARRFLYHQPAMTSGARITRRYRFLFPLVTLVSTIETTRASPEEEKASTTSTFLDFVDGTLKDSVNTYVAGVSGSHSSNRGSAVFGVVAWARRSCQFLPLERWGDRGAL